MTSQLPRFTPAEVTGGNINNRSQTKEKVKAKTRKGPKKKLCSVLKEHTWKYPRSRHALATSSTTRYRVAESRLRWPRLITGIGSGCRSSDGSSSGGTVLDESDMLADKPQHQTQRGQSAILNQNMEWGTTVVTPSTYRLLKSQVRATPPLGFAVLGRRE